MEKSTKALVATAATGGTEPAKAEHARRSHRQIVELAEQHVVAHAGERLHVADLCRVADVSERTLECAFKSVTGSSPLVYLIRLRLRHVRAALLSAEPGSTQVSHEALKWGFSHFGEFSSAYKRCFGETPSETLRREPGRVDLSSNTVARR